MGRRPVRRKERPVRFGRGAGRTKRSKLGGVYESDVPGSATTIFLLFFGVALIDALVGGSVYGILFWLAVGAAFFVADLRRVRRVRESR